MSSFESLEVIIVGVVALRSVSDVLNTAISTGPSYLKICKSILKLRYKYRDRSLFSNSLIGYLLLLLLFFIKQ